MTTLSTHWPNQRHVSDALEVYLLGVVDFDSAVTLQKLLATEIVRRDDRFGRLLVCEHPPILTIGREGRQQHVQADANDLIARQIQTRRLNRGGGCLIHCPGQLVVYPIVPVDRLRCGLLEFRARLELAVIDMCRDLRVPAYRRVDKPGAWCRCGQFAFLGVAIQSGVSQHGLFINVNPDLHLMRLAQTDDEGERITSLSAQKARPVAMSKVRESLTRHLAARLGYEDFHPYTGHPLLKRTKQRIHVSPSDPE